MTPSRLGAMSFVAVVLVSACGPVTAQPSPPVAIASASAAPTGAQTTAVFPTATATSVPSPSSMGTPTPGPTAGASASPSPTTTVTPAASPTTLAPTATPPATTGTPSPVITIAPTQAPTSVDYYSSLPPVCPQTAPGGPTCRINLPANAPDGSTTYQASARDYVLIRIGDGEPTQAACLSYQNGATVTITLDGSAVPVAIVACSYAGSLAAWLVDYRFLSPPLAPGTHVAAATIVINTTTSRFARSIAVSP